MNEERFDKVLYQLGKHNVIEEITNMDESVDVYGEYPDDKESLIELKTNKKHSGSMKKIFIAIVAATMIFGTVVSAANVFKWNKKLAKLFNVDQVQQEKLIDQGVIADVNQSVIDHGLSINVIQTLGDENGVYILLDVIAPEDIVLTGKNFFESNDIIIEGNNDFSYYGGFVQAEEGLKNECEYGIWISNHSQTSLSGSIISLSFSNLQNDEGKLDMYTILKGNWDFSWILNYTDHTKNYEVNQCYKFNGKDLEIKTVQLSPLSFSILLKDYSESIKDDVMIGLKSVTLRDGTVIEGLNGPGFGGSSEINKDDWRVTTLFTQVIDAENVKSIQMNHMDESIDIQ